MFGAVKGVFWHALLPKGTIQLSEVKRLNRQVWNGSEPWGENFVRKLYRYRSSSSFSPSLPSCNCMVLPVLREIPLQNLYDFPHLQ